MPSEGFRMFRRSTPPLLLILLGMFLTTPFPNDVAAAAPPPARSDGNAVRRPVKESWYGVYLAGKRAGYLVNRESRTRWRGRPADLSVTHSRLDLRVLGAQTTSRSEGRSWTTRAGAPLEEISVERSGGRTTRVRAVYSPRSVAFEADLAGQRRSGTLRLKPGERFWVGDPLKGRKGPAQTETRIRYKQFNTTTLTLEDADLTIGRRTRAADREIIAVGGQGVAAFKIPLRIGGAPATLWVDRRHEVLRFDVGPARMVRLPKRVAVAPLTQEVEVTDIASYVPDRPIEAPRSLRRGRYRIENLTAPLATDDDDVQSVQAEASTAPAGRPGTVLITVRTGPAGDAPPTPLAAIPRDRFARYLAPSLYVPSDEAGMAVLARKIVGDETDARRAADRLSAWVFEHLTYDAGQGVGVLRGAREILTSRRGVCQDYATLLVTLARAAGIPAKHCSGLAYSDGRFFLHAWPQVWVGRWVALEPTWGAPFADATHIKLAEGEITDFFGAAADAGSLQIRVIRAATDSAR
jgi:transglutaminase-like putative cysteine protease